MEKCLTCDQLRAELIAAKELNRADRDRQLGDRNEINRLRADLAQLKESPLGEQLFKVQRELAEAREALEFYGDIENWECGECWYDGNLDYGRRARAFLEKHGRGK